MPTLIDAACRARVPIDPRLRARAVAASGFLPEDEGLFLYDAAWAALPYGPVLEIGTYCGKATIFLGAAARARGGLVVTVDHHRGSAEHQLGREYHDPTLVDDPVARRIDTLPIFRRTILEAGLEDVVVGAICESATLASVWDRPLAMVFIDGGHTEQAAQTDYAAWGPHVMQGGLLAIHDVFPDPRDGGRAPYHIYLRALEDGFIEIGHVGSLRILQHPA